MRPADGISSTLLVLLLVGLAHLPDALAEGLPESLVAVRLNGIDIGENALLLRGPDGHLLLRRGDLQRWRLGIPAASPFWQDGEAFYRLDDMAGVLGRFDEGRQALAIEAAAGLFDRTRLDLAARNVAMAAPTSPGLLLNYDLSTSRAGRQRQSGALLGLGAFHRLGSGLANFAVRDGYPTGPRVLRLDTGWTLDLQEQRASLRLGDAVSGASQWARSVRLGGVQWATNFATQPGLVTFPLPSMTGETALPSTVDLYVNGALRLRRDLPAGPFSLQQMPALTGQGELQLVVRDLLGREQRIVAPYYASPRLLQKGLHDFSYEAGRVREDFGVASNHYGRAALFATHRLGVSDSVTVEGHGEWIGSLQVGGLAGVLLVPGFGTVNAAVAASRDGGAAGRSGQLLGAGVDHHSRYFGFGMNTQFASSGFEQAGQTPGRLALRQNLQTYANVSWGQGSLSLAYLLQTPRDGDAVRLLSLTYGVSLGPLGFLGLTLLRSIGSNANLMVSVNFSRPLDGRTSVNTNTTVRQGDDPVLAQVQLQRNLPAGEGAGYRLAGATGANPSLQAGGVLRHGAGTVGLDVDLSRAQAAVRANVSGGLAWVDGGLYASPRIDESFAVVEVPGQAGVGVYADHQLVARTGADGKVLLPRLRPYQLNTLQLEPADLALDTQIESLEMEAVPAYRSGLALRFPVRRSRAATLTVRQPGGQPVPAGALASVEGQAQSFPFGTGGQLYLFGLQPANRVVARWVEGGRQRVCTFDLALPAADDALPDLGLLTCAAATP